MAVLMAASCGEDAKPSTFTCMGQTVSSVAECANAMTAGFAQLQTRGQTVADMIASSGASPNAGTTVAQMIAGAQQFNQQTQQFSQQTAALSQVPEMSESVDGQQALATIYGKQAEFYQRQADLTAQQRLRDEQEFQDAMERARQQQRLDDAAQLHAAYVQKIQEDEIYRDEFSDRARRSAALEDEYGD